MGRKNDILVLGAGIIGLSCAYELSKRGAKVVVIEQGSPGLGCSYGNAGWLTPALAKPLPMPGMILKSIEWLLNPMSPLHIQPQASLSWISWLMRFLASTRPAVAYPALAALAELARYSYFEFSRLSQELPIPFELENKGLLVIAQTQEGLMRSQMDQKLMAEYSIPGELLDRETLREFEPALKDSFLGGIYYPEEAHCEPYLVIKAYEKAVQLTGVQIISHAEAFDFKFNQSNLEAIHTTQGWFEAEQFILATGSWSNALAKKLGITVPILGGKGYALTLDSPNPAPRVPILISEKKVAITPRKDSIRLAGTLELVDQDFSISPHRVQGILESSKEILNFSNTAEPREIWRGLRPCTPDGVPMIGYSKHYDNLFISTGHQMMGLKTAPATARLTADLITQCSPIFDPSPFDPNRFG